MTTAATPTPRATLALSPEDVRRIRADFPILKRQVNGQPLVYLDNAATTQKPGAVIRAVEDYYTRINSNVHRGVHRLSQEATTAYEESREKVRRHLNALKAREIVFVRGTTEAVNLVAQSYARPTLSKGDEVLITHMEHHSNIVPWQIVCQQTGATLRVAPINDAGELDMEAFERLLGPRTRLVACIHISNALGTVNPVGEVVRLAHAVGAVVLVDGAQAVPHMGVNVQALGCDFYTCSGHKTYGPTGIGVLYGREDLLDRMPPYQGGGEMIKSVTFEETTYNDLPHKFEAGTPNIAGAIGFGAAIDYVRAIGLDAIAAHERALLEYATRALAEMPKVRLIGTAREKAAIVSFVVDGIHPHDMGTVLDLQGVAVRTGHHCAQPVMDRFSVPATIRASLAMYNTSEEIDALVAGVREGMELFR